MSCLICSIVIYLWGILVFIGKKSFIVQFVSVALALASYECEPPDSSYEKHHYKQLKWGIMHADLHYVNNLLSAVTCLNIVTYCLCKGGGVNVVSLYLFFYVVHLSLQLLIKLVDGFWQNLVEWYRNSVCNIMNENLFYLQFESTSCVRKGMWAVKLCSDILGAS